jgi:pyridoxine 5-phosphate synthase
MQPLRLGVNIDHVATLRNARGHTHPDPLRAAEVALAAGADSITAHLREDRRHIVDDDISRLAEMLAARRKPLNLEMAATEEMRAIALRIRPHAACIVPERREERTTEGGLDVAGQRLHLAPFVRALGKAGIRVSLFIAPDVRQLDAARAVGAPVVELHTGAYCEAKGGARARELNRIVRAARHAQAIGLECHAGHGLDFANVGAIAAVPTIVELNIGHFLVGEAVFTGLGSSIRRMRALMDEARNRSQATTAAAASESSCECTPTGVTRQFNNGNGKSESIVRPPTGGTAAAGRKRRPR